MWAFGAARAASSGQRRSLLARIAEGARDLWGSLQRDKYQRLLEKAERLVARQDPQGALETCQRIVRALSPGKRSSPQTRRYLGRAYLTQGRIQASQRKTSASVQSYLAARRLVALPEPALAFLAGQLAAEKDSSAQAIRVYIDYLQLRRGHPKSSESDPIHSFLQGLCPADDRLPADKRRKAQALCQRILKVDESIEWAQYHCGFTLVASGEHAKALGYLERAAQLNPRRTETTYLIGVCRGVVSEQQGDRAAALTLFREAISVLDGRPEAHFFLGRALVAECEALEQADAPDVPQRIPLWAQEAVTSLMRLAALRLQDSACHYYLGRAHSYAGAAEAAVQAYRKAVELQPNEKHYLLGLAAGLARLSDLDSALRTVERAVALDSNCADGYQVWGDLSLAKGERDRAVECYRRALAINAGHVRARVGLGQALYLLAHFGDAIRELEPVRSTSRQAAFLLARCYALTGQPDRALPLLEALTGRPDASAEMFYYLGCARASLGQYPAAIDVYTTCLSRDPSRWQAHLQRGHCHLAVRNAADGLRDYTAAAAAQPQDPDVVLGMARSHLMQGDPEAARPLLEQTVRGQPTHAEAFMLLGALGERVGDMAGAERSYLTALQLDANRGSPHAQLGLLHSHQGRHQQACQQLKAAMDAGLDTDAVLFHLAFSLSCCADYAGALEACLKLQQRHPDDQRIALNVKRLQYLLGCQFARDEKYAEATLAWEEYLKDRPEDERLKQDLAELYFRQGVARLATTADAKEGQKALAAAQQLNPCHPYVNYYCALAHLTDGQSTEAAERLARLAEQEGRIALRAGYHQAIVLLQTGEFARAAQLLEAIAQCPQCKELDLPIGWALALAYGQNQQWEKALCVLEAPR
jgi:tetratricopeptide (TPR) repeat protein